MSLAHLTHDVLGLIFSYNTNSRSYVNLWNCGNLKLQSKLRSGIVHVYWHCFRWERLCVPSSLSELSNLRHLYFISTNELFIRTPDATKALSNLPRGLLTLHICTPDAHLVLLNFAPSWRSDEESFIQTQYKIGKSRLIDLGTIFPHLQDLMLSCVSRDPLAICDFPGLPASLTRLSLPHVYVEEPSAPFMAHLPRSLTDLNAHIAFDPDCWTKQTWADPPPNLTRIEALASPDFMDLALLPRTLEIADIQEFEATTQSRHFPPNLRVLAVRGASEEPWEPYLPPNLTTLELYHASTRCSTIETLPRSLTSLHWGRDVVPLFKHGTVDPSLWPAALTSLVLVPPLANYEHLGLLPKTLKALMVWLQDFGGVFQSDKLPTHLESLSVHQTYDQNFRFSHPLPELKSLVASGLLESSAMLPKTLEFLDTKIPSGLDSFILPSNLTSLEIYPWPFEWFEHLPQSLTSLRIPILDVQHVDPAFDISRFLPPNLRDLELVRVAVYEDPLTCVSADSFSSLKHLTNLTIHDVIIFPSAVLRNLRPGLLELDLRLQSIEEADAPFLPRTLTELDLHCDEYPDYVAKYWPLSASGRIKDTKLRRAVQARCPPKTTI